MFIDDNIFSLYNTKKFMAQCRKNVPKHTANFYLDPLEAI